MRTVIQAGRPLIQDRLFKAAQFGHALRMRVLVFDSGIGGVLVAAALRTLLPGAALIYLMDDAGFPYGARTEPDLTTRILHALAAGIARAEPDLAVIACNTASTAALAALRAQHSLPFVGCVPPIKSAATASHTRTIGVLATPATVRGPYLRALAAQHAPDCRVLVHGAANLARLAEHSFAGRTVTREEIQAELAGLLAQPGAGGIDAVALGCTHYAQLLPQLRACLPPTITWHDPAFPVARQAARVAATLPARPGQGLDGRPDGLILHTGTKPLFPGPGWTAAGFSRAETLSHP